MKDSNHLLCERGLRLFKGPCLLVFPNVLEAMLIQGATFIPDSIEGITFAIDRLNFNH